MVPLLRVANDYDGANAALDRGLSLYPPDGLFLELVMRSQAVMLCVDSGRPEKAAEHLECCRRILAEQEDWLGIAGPVWRAEGIVAALEGWSQESDDHFAKAIENHRQYSLPWDEAETLHYWGRALLRAGQLHRAQERLDAAIKIYRDHGAGQCWIDRVEADQRQAQPLRIERDASTAGAIDLRQPRSTGPDEGVFRKEGDFWTITYGGRTFRLHDMKGLAYIAHLLAHAGERIHVHDLLATVEGTAAGDGRIRMAAERARQDGLEVVRELGDAGEALDLRARGEYRRRLGELRAELEDAEGQNDPGRGKPRARRARVPDRRAGRGSGARRTRAQDCRARGTGPRHGHQKHPGQSRADRPQRRQAGPSLRHLHPHRLPLCLSARSRAQAVLADLSRAAPARESPSSDFTVVTLVFPPEVVEAYVRCPRGRRFVQHTERERSRPHSSRRASKHLRKCRLQTARGRRSHAHEREALCRKEAA